MKTFKQLIALFIVLFSGQVFSANNGFIIQNVSGRNTQSLNGKWNYIVDPYENGFYNYRLQPFDELEKPGNGAFFMDYNNDKISIYNQDKGLASNYVYNIMQDSKNRTWFSQDGGGVSFLKDNILKSPMMV